MIKTALIGNPTSHSVSPFLFSIYAAEHGIEYAHIKIDVTRHDLEKSMKSLIALGFSGYNVTLPYKSDVMKYLDEVDEVAERIGAVNTVVIDIQGKTKGYNTDILGALLSLEELLGRSVASSDRCLVIGTGGASRAVTTGLLDKRARVFVTYREPLSDRTRSFTKDFGSRVEFVDKKDIEKCLDECNVIYNATSAGMEPHIEELPIPLKAMDSSGNPAMYDHKIFMDAIFNPYETKFLQAARLKGAKTMGGTNWMIYQGVRAFRLWTGLDVSRQSQTNAMERLREVLRVK